MDGFYEEGIQLRSLRMRLLNTFSDQASEARTRHVKHPTPTPKMNNQKYKFIGNYPPSRSRGWRRSLLTDPNVDQRYDIRAVKVNPENSRKIFTLLAAYAHDRA